MKTKMYHFCGWVLVRRFHCRFWTSIGVISNSCHCFYVKLVKLHPVHRYSVDIFTYSGPSGILGFDKSRIPLKPMLGGVRILALPISSQEQTEGSVF